MNRRERIAVVTGASGWRLMLRKKRPANSGAIAKLSRGDSGLTFESVFPSWTLNSSTALMRAWRFIFVTLLTSLAFSLVSGHAFADPTTFKNAGLKEETIVVLEVTGKTAT